MSTLVGDRVDSWDDRPFEGGYRKLQELADSGFSGVVRAGGAELFLTKGTLVGVGQGRIEDVQGATGTVYEAPTPSLSLLAIMQARADEARAKYYTEDTSVSTVDQKLADGNFTGYIELSENVLSGDYYIVYHQGHSMSAAFVGESSRLLDGDEAFAEIDDEVGIYEVTSVDIEPVEIPEPREPTDEPPSPPSDTPETEVVDEVDESPAREGADTEETSSESESGSASTTEQETGEEPADGPSSEAETGSQADSKTGRETNSPTQEERRDRSDEATDPTEEPPVDNEERSGRDEETGRRLTDDRTSGGQTSESGGTRERKEPTGEEQTSRQTTPTSGGTSAPMEPTTGTADRRGTEARGPSETSGGAPPETRSIPSLDPARTEAGESTPDTGAGTTSPTRRDSGQARAQTESRTEPEPRPPQRKSQQQSQTTEQSTPEASTSETEQSQQRQPTESKQVEAERVEELEDELEERESRLEEVTSRLDAVSTERDDLEAELDAVRDERDELAEEIERLETEIESLEAEFGAATGAERRLTPGEALDMTDIFVRYHSKGDATLAKALEGGIRRSDLEDNLRLEKHTQFDEESVAVGGQEFGEFLENRLEFQFIQWAIYELIFEIRDTGHSTGLADLFDAIPHIDRAELNAVVEVVYSEEGQETRSTESFDVVLRDRMGDPLVVANLNDSREAATEGDMEGLVTAAERVGQTAEEFGAAFFVTRSFFEPGALETASQATRGGLLSRDKRQSFVNLSRKRGYHLCLVEARNNNFHLAVPEL